MVAKTAPRLERFSLMAAVLATKFPSNALELFAYQG
jgi:hypothetical protein